MKSLRALLLGACVVAAPLAIAATHAHAATPSAQQVVLYDITGRPVAVLTPLEGGIPAPQQLRPAGQ